MNAKYAVLLGLVVINATNKAIRFKEDSTTSTVNVAEGVYFLRGNYGATDLCKAVSDALDSHSGTNTYEVTVTFSRLFSAPTAEVSIERATGSASFSILWSDAATTFVPALLGFEAEDTAHNGTAKESTLSPSCVWASNNIINRLEPQQPFMVEQDVSRGNVVSTVERMTGLRHRFWVQEYVHAQRMVEESNGLDPTATLGRFLARHADGKRFEFHECDVDTGNTLVAPNAHEHTESDDGGTRVGTFVFSTAFFPEMGRTFADRRRDSPLYAFEGLLLRYHEEDVVETSVYDVSDLIFWFRAEDAFAVEGSQDVLVDRAGVLPLLRCSLVNGGDATPSGSISKNGIAAITVTGGNEVVRGFQLAESPIAGGPKPVTAFVTSGNAFTCFLFAHLPANATAVGSEGRNRPISYTHPATLDAAFLHYAEQAGAGAVTINASHSSFVAIPTATPTLYVLVSDGASLKLYIDDSLTAVATKTAAVTLPNKASWPLLLMHGTINPEAGEGGFFEAIGVKRALTPGDDDWNTILDYINDHYDMGW